MSWSYDASMLATSALFRVRFLSGDVDTTDQLVQDEEITYLLTQTTNETIAAAMVLEHLSRKFSRYASKRIGSLSITAAERASAFAKRASELRTEAGILCEVFVGGISISGKEALDEDSDAVQPSFRMGQDDNPRAPNERNPTRDDLPE